MIKKIVSKRYDTQNASKKIKKNAANKILIRGKVSAYILAFIFIVCLFAEVLANDKPLIIKFKSDLYFPIVQTYSEITFGGDFEAEADYTDPYLLDKIALNGWAVWPPVKYHYDTINYDLTYPSPPSSENLLGLDDQGRDVLSRLIYGLRISLIFASSLTFIIALFALTAGVIQGFLGGWVDLIGQRLSEIWAAIPVMFVVMIVASLAAPSFFTLTLVLASFGWHYLAQLVRAEVLKTRQLEYVQSALILGVSDWRIMWRHIMPNALITTLSSLPFIFSGSLGALVTLDFLGFGLPVGYPSLGEIVAQAKNNLHAPWLGLVGCGAIFTVITLVVLIGEGVQEWLSPLKGDHNA